MKIGILGAMIEEVSSIKEMMNVEHEITLGQRTYITGKIGDNNVVLTFSRWGKVASSCTTTTLINKFEVDFIVFLGVAGAVDKRLNIGDIVVGTGFYQHDMDARPLFSQFQIPLTNTILFKPDATDVSQANLASEKFIEKIDKTISHALLMKHSIFKPKVYRGIIASGDKFITNPQSHEELSYTNGNNKTLAVEMEGAAVAQVCHEHDVPYVVIRTISDKADHSAVVEFKSFINDIACKYSLGILNEYLKLVPYRTLKATEYRLTSAYNSPEQITSSL